LETSNEVDRTIHESVGDDHGEAASQPRSTSGPDPATGGVADPSGEEFQTFEWKLETYPFTVLTSHRGRVWETVVNHWENGNWQWLTRRRLPDNETEAAETVHYPLDGIHFGSTMPEPLDDQILTYIVAQIDAYIDKWETEPLPKQRGSTSEDHGLWRL
jgi:hypothetical protein